MAAKSKTMFRCKSCQREETKWLGRCPGCGAWNSFTEVTGAAAESGGGAGGRNAKSKLPIPLPAVENKDGMRLDSGIAELNRVLGGGIMRGSSVLVGGEPGIGKSTLMLQAAASLEGEGRVLYISGEESAAQLRLRADRLGATRERVEVLCETGLDPIRETMARLKPSLTIIDS